MDFLSFLNTILSDILANGITGKLFRRNKKGEAPPPSVPIPQQGTIGDQSPIQAVGSIAGSAVIAARDVHIHTQADTSSKIPDIQTIQALPQPAAVIQQLQPTITGITPTEADILYVLWRLSRFGTGDGLHPMTGDTPHHFRLLRNVEIGSRNPGPVYFYGGEAEKAHRTLHEKGLIFTRGTVYGLQSENFATTVVTEYGKTIAAALDLLYIAHLYEYHLFLRPFSPTYPAEIYAFHPMQQWRTILSGAECAPRMRALVHANLLAESDMTPDSGAGLAREYVVTEQGYELIGQMATTHAFADQLPYTEGDPYQI